MDPRGKEKERLAKNNLAAHNRKGEVQSRVAVLERGAHCSARQESMESTCGGPMRQLGARGQVKVKRHRHGKTQLLELAAKQNIAGMLCSMQMDSCILYMDEKSMGDSTRRMVKCPVVLPH